VAIIRLQAIFCIAASLFSQIRRDGINFLLGIFPYPHDMLRPLVVAAALFATVNQVHATLEPAATPLSGSATMTPEHMRPGWPRFTVPRTEPPPPATDTGASDCRGPIARAERQYGIPAGLLAAIARIESGRRDPRGGAWNPWPWTTNVEGQGEFHDGKAKALAVVQASRARGSRSIDVGCMQVNLMHHPDAFATLEQAFDPAQNVDYAARFLVRLHDQSGTWPKAAALYHSATPELGEAYQRKVLAVWPEEQRGSAGAIPLTAAAQPIVNRVETPRVIALAGASGPTTTIAGIQVPGRTLASYRAMPVFSGWTRPRH